MTKILVVDDEPDLELLIKQRFRKKIRENEYEFIFANNGNEALEKLNKHSDVEVVLSDINMPEMDGLTLLTKLSEKHHLLKSVMVSAYGDMENIRVAMNRGAFDFITKPINFEDLEVTMEKTIKHVIQIRDTMKALKENNILKMYVDETVINFMSGQEYEISLKRNETIDATVAFIDICGFTQITEKESPDTVVNLINSYFDIIVREVLEQDGVIDKFMGDAVMAVFSGDYNLDRAIDASLVVRDKINDISSVNSPGNYTPKVSIGINGGEIISGNIGSAELKRLDFTVIGDSVNLALRLQTAASEGEILISESSFEKVGESFKCEKVGELDLKNKKEKVMAYRVLA
jgi:adenylate cyclase